MRQQRGLLKHHADATLLRRHGTARPGWLPTSDPVQQDRLSGDGLERVLAFEVVGFDSRDGIDDAHPFVSWPLAPDRTKLIVYTLFPPAFFSDPDFADKVGAYRQQIIKTLEEDMHVITSLQKAMATERFRPGHMASLEKGVHHVINYYVERMFGPSR